MRINLNLVDFDLIPDPRREDLSGNRNLVTNFFGTENLEGIIPEFSENISRKTLVNHMFPLGQIATFQRYGTRACAHNAGKPEVSVWPDTVADSPER
jgi:hypothetical protein